MVLIYDEENLVEDKECGEKTEECAGENCKTILGIKLTKRNVIKFSAIGALVLALIMTVTVLLIFSGSESGEEAFTESETRIETGKTTVLKENGANVFYVKGEEKRMMATGEKNTPVEIECAETEVYASKDGSVILYGVNKKRSGDFTLVYANAEAPDEYKEIVSGVETFSVHKELGMLSYMKKGNYYISYELTEKGEKFMSGEDSVRCWQDDYKALIVRTFDEEDDYKHILVDLEEGEEVEFEDDIDNIAFDVEGSYRLKSVDDFYYTNYECELCHYKDGEIEVVEEYVDKLGFVGDTLFYSVINSNSDSMEYDLYALRDGESEKVFNNANEVYIEGRLLGVEERVINEENETVRWQLKEVYYFTEDGGLIELEVQNEMFLYDVKITPSLDGKYIYRADENGTLYRYEIKDGVVENGEKVCHNVNHIYYSGDVLVAQCDGYETLGVIYDDNYIELCDYRGSYLNIIGDEIYYIKNEKLYSAKYSETGKVVKGSKAGVRAIYAVGEKVYYIAGDAGELYVVGNDKMIDDNVTEFGTYVEERREKAEEFETTEMETY